MRMEGLKKRERRREVVSGRGEGKDGGRREGGMEGWREEKEQIQEGRKESNDQR